MSYTFVCFLIGNFVKVNNLCATFQLKEVSLKLCSTSSNKDNGQLAEEIVYNKNDSSDNYEQDIKSKILQSSLPFVPQHGWSRDTIAAGIHF